MYQVKFNDSEEIYDINAFQESGSVVTLKGFGITNNNSGFIFMRDGEFVKDFSEYTTKYNVLTEIENGIMLSKDGSIETEYNRVRVTTAEDEAVILAQMKQDKIAESKTELAVYLAEHPMQSYCHGGIIGNYNVTTEKQSLMMSQYMTYQIEKAINLDAKLTWNETGEACEEWTEEEFLQLIMEVKRYVYPIVSHQQTLEKQIVACTTAEELEAIMIDYGSLS